MIHFLQIKQHQIKTLTIYNFKVLLQFNALRLIKLQ